MAKVESWSCDVCSTQKKEANHWWKIYLIEGGALVLGWEAECLRMVGGTDEATAHLCGIQHVLEWLSKNVLEVKG